jgi:hypothetical protein
MTLPFRINAPAAVLRNFASRRPPTTTGSMPRRSKPLSRLRAADSHFDRLTWRPLLRFDHPEHCQQSRRIAPESRIRCAQLAHFWWLMWPRFPDEPFIHPVRTIPEDPAKHVAVKPEALIQRPCIGIVTAPPFQGAQQPVRDRWLFDFHRLSLPSLRPRGKTHEYQPHAAHRLMFPEDDDDENDEEDTRG